MSKHDNNDKYDSRENPEKKDVWYKLRSIGGISTAIVAALIGVMGSIFLHSQQDKSNKIQLYSQLMSDQERAENDVRKDMFTKILASFLDEKGRNNGECIADKVNRQLLELEMISRNFHETMDMRPLFIYMLLKIVRDIPRSYDFTDQELENLDELNSCKKKVVSRLLKREEFQNANKEKKMEMIKQRINNLKKRTLNRIINIAKRITKKQLESLSDVEMRVRFTIDLEKTCQDRAPNKLKDEDECGKRGTNIGPIDLTLNDNKKESKRSRRTFTIISNRSYPDWNQVRLKVITNKLPKEEKADKYGPDKKNSEFWVGFFDFPLVDNTFISSKERYAVILDSINEKKAEVSLLYFPASYAGFKEKSYYQHRMMNTLLRDSSVAN